MALGVHSEIGTLRRAMLHRPGLEHTRLTPSNAEELLFDDVIWVKRAKEEHAVYAEELFAGTLGDEAVQEWVCDPILKERMVGPSLAKAAPEWVASNDPATVADFLIGGGTRGDLPSGKGLLYESPDPPPIWVPPLPTFIFQRDSSCWIYGGVTVTPMAKPARRPETMIV